LDAGSGRNGQEFLEVCLKASIVAFQLYFVILNRELAETIALPAVFLL